MQAGWHRVGWLTGVSEVPGGRLQTCVRCVTLKSYGYDLV